MKTDAAARAAEIPGLVLRPYRGTADIGDMVRIQNAEWEADGLSYRETDADRVAEYAHPSAQFDPARDLTIAEVDGRAVAYANRSWTDANDGVRQYRCGGTVDPQWRRRGIGTVLLRENEARGRALGAELGGDRPSVFSAHSEDRNPAAQALLEREGYRRERWFFDMERHGIDGELPEPPALPDGIELRPVQDDELLTIWHADIEAFRDHWGGSDESEEAFRRYQDAPDFDPGLWVVAWDGSEVASAVVNTIYVNENQATGRRRGWLDSVFTRRPWRRRGLASALIVRSLHVLAARGMDTAALGVDADNPNGALRLYESFGFAVTERANAWRRDMDPRPA